MTHVTETDQPCTPEAPSCAAHREGRSWMLTCPQPQAESDYAMEVAALALYLDEYKHWHNPPQTWGHTPESTREHFRRKARVALEAVAGLTTPPGERGQR